MSETCEAIGIVVDESVAMLEDALREPLGPQGEDAPSIIGTSGEVRSINALSIPSPHSADIRCSTVCTLTPSFSRQDDNLVSTTEKGFASIETMGFKSTRLKTIPVLGAAGRNVSETFFPVWRPTPVALTRFFNVRCLIM